MGMVGAVLTFTRGATRRWLYPLIWSCAILSISSWTMHGRFQTIAIDTDKNDLTPTRPKARAQRPFHVHEFVHYYLGAKYFRELGYLGLYDCIALADAEIADESRIPAKASGWIRDLDDVLTDKPYTRALADCTTAHRNRFTSARWSGFKQDIREISRLVDDGAWPTIVFDAGFNPPPSLIVISTAVTNLIPIRSGTTETYLLATSIDLLLLVVCFVVLRRAFGRTIALVAVIYFGSTFISHYTWNGGSVLRFTWFVEVLCGCAMLKLGRWRTAAVLLALASCDRLFPAAFAAFAMVPVAFRALRSPADRLILRRFGVAYVATVAGLVALSLVVFGPGTWGTFLARIGRHGDIYYVMHIGLKKVITFRDWVPSKNFHGHEGLARFRDWNLQLRATWVSMRPLVLPLQAALTAGALWATARRRPHEAAMLGGVLFMFAFNLPANYYYVIVTPVPALLLRAAATTRDPALRLRNLAAFGAFNLFWMFTFVANQVHGDGIVFNFYICCAFGLFLLAWMVAWVERRTVDELRAYWRSRSRRPGEGPGGGAKDAAGEPAKTEGGVSS
jgi:hypothetical protein